MDYKAEELIKLKPYQFDENEKKPGGIFYDSLMEEICFHYENNEKYKRFCDIKGFCPSDFKGDIAEIPPVQVSVFKNLGRELASVPKEQIKLILQSSATSGVPSSIPVDKMTSRRQAKAMVHVIGDYIGNERKPFLIMDVDPSTGFRDILGARFAAVSGYLNFASKAGYFLKVNENRKYYFDVDGMKSFIEELDPGEPAVVFGFTYILYSEVICPLTRQNIQFSLPRGSKIIHIGGWKKLESEKISREEFNQRAAKLFGIEPEDVIDIYGFTEQMGLNYPTCPCGCKHASIYSEVIVRDVRTKQVLPSGKEGLLEFITPVPHSYPGNAVLTDDIGVIEEGICPYGRAGTRFRVLGRLKNAEIRGCGDILSNKLTFAGHNDVETAENTSGYRVEYFYDARAIDTMSPKESLATIMERLRENLTWIRKQPIDALIGLIAQVAKKWTASAGNSSKTMQTSGMSFLASWCTPEHLTSLMTEGLNGNRMYADTFLSVSDDSIQLRKAVSRGLACHWLAGNVQVLGMFVLIESILTKNVNILKISSKDEGTFCSLLKAFEGESYRTAGGCTVTGDDLLKTIAVVYYDHSDKELGQLMSEKADIRIAWGGADAVTAVTNYPAKYDCEDLIMGPKLSFAVVSREAISDEHKAKKIGRRIGIDASVFDQTGCASAHNVYVERGGAITPEEFARYLAEGMKKAAIQIPKGNISAEQIAAIHSIRGVYDFKGMVMGDSDSNWTVLYDPDDELCKPVYSRVIFVHPVDSIMDAASHIDDNIQTIGLAADGQKALEFATAAADRGAVRFPVCGRMLNFDSPWDGMYLTDRMVRWVTIGGPVV